jgi:hypothetical protein
LRLPIRNRKFLQAALAAFSGEEFLDVGKGDEPMSPTDHFQGIEMKDADWEICATWAGSSRIAPRARRRVPVLHHARDLGAFV